MKTFSIINTCGAARTGELALAHGVIRTPVFLPVGSQGTVKTLTPSEIHACGFNMVLSNSYHLYLRPGTEALGRVGGLHRFMGWDGGILTDSGGFQVFSLAPLVKLTDEGVRFRSHIDGSEHFLTPETAIKNQETIGADVIMVLDQCTAYGASEENYRAALARTHLWAARCREAHTRADQLLFGIVQGGFSAEMRRESAVYLGGLDFPGYAIGGMSVGEPKDLMWQTLDITMTVMPADKPRYLMGVGAPEDIVEGVYRGIDIFDSALPTRVARNGALFTWEGRRNIRNAEFAANDGPFLPGCDCYTCRTFSAAYLHHLFRAEELLVYRLATIHNLRFIGTLMERIRLAIEEGRFPEFRENFLARYQITNEQIRVSQKQKWIKARGLGGAGKE